MNLPAGGGQLPSHRYEFSPPNAAQCPGGWPCTHYTAPDPLLLPSQLGQVWWKPRTQHRLQGWSSGQWKGQQMSLVWQHQRRWGWRVWATLCTCGVGGYNLIYWSMQWSWMCVLVIWWGGSGWGSVWKGWMKVTRLIEGEMLELR